MQQEPYQPNPDYPQYAPPQYPQPGYPPQQAPQYQQPMQQAWPQQQPGYPPQQVPQYQQPMQPYQGMPQQYPGQPMMPMMQPQVMQTNVNVNLQQKNGPGFVVRALYFLFFGWWAGFIWLNIGFGLCALIFTLPIGLMMLNRLPKVMTLKPDSSSTNVNVSTVNVQQPYGGSVIVQNVNVNISGAQQHSFLLRAVYFLCIGFWAGYIWAYIAYACCLTIFLLPVGVIMFDSLPVVLTLRKN
jgi:uncharacterized membrane protein YccF (DUF307 family)